MHYAPPPFSQPCAPSPPNPTSILKASSQSLIRNATSKPQFSVAGTSSTPTAPIVRYSPRLALPHPLSQPDLFSFFRPKPCLNTKASGPKNLSRPSTAQSRPASAVFSFDSAPAPLLRN